MAAPELIKRLERETKMQVLVAEAHASQFATSELAELLDLMVSGPAEKSALAVAVLDALVSSGVPAGRIEDLRKAFGAPPGTGRSSLPHAAPPAPAPAPGTLIRGTASQQTRPVQSPFRTRFDAGRVEPPPAPAPAAEEAPLPPPPSPLVPPPVVAPAAPAASRPAAATAPGAPAAPRAPLPLRGKAAELLKSGAPAQPAPTVVPPVPAAPVAPPPHAPVLPVPPRAPAENARQGTVFFGDSRGKPTTEAVLGPAANRPTVLLADDDKRIRMVFRLKLEEKGFNIQEASDGQEAWKRIEVGGIDAVVLDMKMPGLHGLEVLSRLADSGKGLPVVICTAYDRLDDEFVVATYPKLRYLTKPVDAGQLAETLINLLAE